MQHDLAADIAATFERVRRPLRWPMEDFGRKKVANRGFVGYRFARARRKSVAGFCFGFALEEAVVAGIADPPEVVAYAFVEPAGSALHRTLVGAPGSAVRRLVAAGGRMGFPFEFHPNDGVAAVRHRSMRAVPSEVFTLVSSDFLMLSYHPIRAARFLERVRKATIRRA